MGKLSIQTSTEIGNWGEIIIILLLLFSTNLGGRLMPTAMQHPSPPILTNQIIVTNLIICIQIIP